MFEGLNRNQTTSVYVSQRLSNGRDDRTLQEKQSSDAWLRGNPFDGLLHYTEQCVQGH